MSCESQAGERADSPCPKESNAVEASHNVFIRFRSKDISLERLHYHVSTNLALLQANLTYMHAVPELYRRMKLPVFDGVQEA